MGVAGGKTILIQGGEEKFWLEKADTKQLISVTGLNMPEITTPFPVWPLEEAFRELQSQYSLQQPQGEPLPAVPAEVGGEPVDIMLGIRYVKYYPQLKFSLNCGLGVYEAQFTAPGGAQGILGGPHKSWKNVYHLTQNMSPKIFFTHEMRAYCFESECLRTKLKDFQHYDASAVDNNIASLAEEEFDNSSADAVETQLDQLIEFGPASLDRQSSVPAFCAVTESIPANGMDSVPAFSFVDSSDEQCNNKHCAKHISHSGWTIPAHWDINIHLYTVRDDLEKYLELENCASELSYRCIKCRNCSDCRKSKALERRP
jgi:hypothetical protein